MLEILKNYYVFMLVLTVVSYLVPKEDYKVYIQFFVSVFLVVLLLKPVLNVFVSEDYSEVYVIFESFRNQIEQLDLKIEEGEDVFEYFFSKGYEE